jgi:hypothetical protein
MWRKINNGKKYHAFYAGIFSNYSYCQIMGELGKPYRHVPEDKKCKNCLREIKDEIEKNKKVISA